MILVTSSNWINCSFSRPFKVRMSFCQIAAKFFFFKFKICRTVARHKYDLSISQNFFCCLSLTNYLISKLQLPYIGIISAIVKYLGFYINFRHFYFYYSLLVYKITKAFVIHIIIVFHYLILKFILCIISAFFQDTLV